MATAEVEPAFPAFLAGGGSVGALIRARDWRGTPFGAPEEWPLPLRLALSLALHSSLPTSIYWGPELHLLYNDAWPTISPERHPWALGRPGAEVWSDIWHVIGPQFAHVLATGQGFSVKNQMLPITADGTVRETYWTYTGMPIRDENGTVLGIINQGHETTAQVLAERRGAFMLRLSDQLRELAEPSEVKRAAAEALGRHLDVTRVGYAEVDPATEVATVVRNWTATGTADITGQLATADLGPLLTTSRTARRTTRVDDVASDPLAAGNRAAFARIGVAAAVDVPLVKRGRLAAIMFVHAAAARTWTEDEVALIEDVAERTWAAVERSKAEKRLREAEMRFRALLTAGSYSFYRMSPDWAEMWQLDGGGFLSDAAEPADNWQQNLHPDDRPAIAAAIRDAIARRSVFELEHRVRRPDGSTGWTVSRAVPILDDRGEIVEWFGAANDVTDRHVAEEARREAGARYRGLFEAIDSGFCIIDLIFDANGRPSDYRFVEVNPAFAQQTGLDDPVGRRMRALAPDHEQDWFDIYGEVARTGEPIRFERPAEALGGRWYDVYAFRLSGADANRVAVLFSDISEQRRAALALAELNETLERRIAEALAERRVLADLVEGTDSLVQVFDRDYRWLAINKAASDEFARIFGPRPKIGDSLTELLADRPEQRDLVRAMWDRALAGEEYTGIAELGSDSRERRCYEMKFNVLRGPDGQQIGAYSFVHDVTERVREQERLREAEEALRQSQKMEAMGQLTGGVAHDFNNLLTPIVGVLDMLQQRRVGGEREQRLIGGAAQSAERARTLVHRLLAFARRQPLRPTAVDVGAVVQGMAELVASTIGPQIRVSIEIAPALPPAKADTNQLEMALLNLSVNARDAMPEGGRLRISVDLETVGGAHPAQLAAGRYVRLSVADTGAGMDETVLARAVEPFFSTKGVGQGTGLGLSMVHGLASQLGGALLLTSRRSLGTNVELWLPESGEQAEPAVGVTELALPPQRGAALLIDDEELVRLTTADMLTDLGFAVREACSAEEGLRIVREGAGLDLVVTDHLMPGMTGSDLAREIRAMRPGLPILVISGYAESEGIEPDLPRLNKPFRKDELVASLAGLVPHGG